MRILLATFGQAGHFHPMVSVLQNLQRRGHALACYAPEDPARQLAAAGIEARSFGDPPVARATLDPVQLGIKLAEPRWAERYLSGALLDSLPRQVEALRAAIRAFSPDVVAVAPVLYAGAIAATLERVPWAAIATNLESAAPPQWPSPHRDLFARLAARTATLAAELGVELELRGGEALSPWLDTVFTTEAFLSREAAENELPFFVGPSLARIAREEEKLFPWERLPTDRPIVYVAFGSVISPPPAVLLRICELLCARGVHVVITGRDQVDRLTWPAGVTAVRWAPQRAVLERATAMVGHGGASSVMECLSAGLPSLIVPLVHDQAIQGRAVAAAGCGLVAAIPDVMGEGGEELFDRLLDPTSTLAPRAREIAASYRAHDGGAAAASLLEELAMKRAPLRPPPPTS